MNNLIERFNRFEKITNESLAEIQSKVKREHAIFTNNIVKLDDE